MDEAEVDQGAPLGLETRILHSEGASELYVTMVPPGNGTDDESVTHVFEAIRDRLISDEAWIFAERIFAAPDAFTRLNAIRSATYGDLADAVPPTCLVAAGSGRLAGVQVHAVRTDGRPRVLEHEGHARGRVITDGSHKWVSLAGVAAPEAGPAPRQARRMFEKAEALLKIAGGTTADLARTWLWLGDICPWYADLNQVRTEFFTERGLIDPAAGRSVLPASTGIGIVPAGGGQACALDAVAIVGDSGASHHVAAGGDQQSAFQYGSAFSRATLAVTPAGKTLFVSGTAAIDDEGRTEHVNDPERQIAATLQHVRAVLHDFGCRDEHVLSAIAYAKTDEIRQEFEGRRDDVPWPCLSLVADVCREELAFEMEVTARVEG
ncbi:MAG: hypothetical protein CMJ83_17140 [Planctomycetes bacterium]|nr:hypothetical protein [Planctomycetota bacterium]